MRSDLFHIISHEVILFTKLRLRNIFLNKCLNNTAKVITRLKFCSLNIRIMGTIVLQFYQHFHTNSIVESPYVTEAIY